MPARGARWAMIAAAAAAGAVVAPANGATMTVVADNLNNPRGVTIAPDGAVYVAEAGKAGPTCIGPPDDQACAALSGSITRVRDGVARRVVRGLASVGGRDGSFTTGADGVSVTLNGTIYIAMTAAPDCSVPRGIPRAIAGQLGRLLKYGPGGRLSRVANIARIECRTNADGADRNSNPYGVLALGRGREIVVDAGANTLVNVKGRRSGTATVFPEQRGRQYVPTSIARGPDGAFYVGGLDEGGGVGAARVFRFVPGEKPRVHMTGFTNITGLDFGPDGSLYVTQLTTAGLEAQKPGGSVIRVAPDGARTSLGVGTLFFPAGTAVDDTGAVYVSNWSVLPGSPAPAGPFKGKNGQLVKITP